MVSATSDLQISSQPHSMPLPQGRYSLPTEGKRLSWPRWLVTYQDGIPINSHQSQS